MTQSNHAQALEITDTEIPCVKSVEKATVNFVAPEKGAFLLFCTHMVILE